MFCARVARRTSVRLFLLAIVLASLLSCAVLFIHRPEVRAAQLHVRSINHGNSAPQRKTGTISTIAAQPSSSHALRNRACLPDGLAGAVSPPLDLGERYLVYSPQFGLSNQLVSLRNAVSWALLLNRTLVLPHLLGHATADVMEAHGSAFATAQAVGAVAPLKIIEMEAFLREGAQSAQVLRLQTKTKYSVASDAYFRALGPRWQPLVPGPALAVPLHGFSAHAIVNAFGGCGHHRVLAFQSLFASFDGKAAADFPAPGLAWLDQQAMPALLTPQPKLASLALQIASRLADPDEVAKTHSKDAPGLAEGPHARPLACAHIRRGDFQQECARYDEELKRPSPRAWVVWHYRQGWSCFQTEKELALNLQVLRSGRISDSVYRPPAVYVAVENATLLRQPLLREFNLSSLGTFSDLVAAARLPLHPNVRDVLLDQLVCAHARLLLLNAYSTFSQLVQGRIGMRFASRVGWTRELAAATQAQLGVQVRYWRRSDPSASSLLDGFRSRQK